MYTTCWQAKCFCSGVSNQPARITVTEYELRSVIIIVLFFFHHDFINLNIMKIDTAAVYRH